MRALVVVVAVTAAWPAARGWACDQVFVPNVGFDVFPRDGASDVPQNVTPFVNAFSFPNPALVADDGGAAVDVDVDVAEAGSPFFVRLQPAAPLAPGRYRITSDAGDVAAFFVGDGVDDDVPAAPRGATVTDVTAPVKDVTGFGCSFAGSGTIVVDAEPDVLLLASATDPQGALGAPVITASTTQTLVVAADEPVVAHVVAVDAAGHVGDALAVDVDIPAASSCAQASPSTWTPLAALLLALAPRRRRAAPRTSD